MVALRADPRMVASGLLLLARLAASIVAASAAYCHGAPAPDARPNLHPIQAESPRAVRAVRNGLLQSVGRGDDEIPLVHVWGTAYERGLAQGMLMRTEIAEFVPLALAFFADEAARALNSSTGWMPLPVAEWVARVGIDAALDATASLTARSTGRWFDEELVGLAHGSRVSIAQLRRMHMIGELTRGRCSMFGAWGEATGAGALLQLRALDWETGGPFQRFPQVTVYHASDSARDGHSFVTVGWSGWIGAVSGMSDVALGISEIGVSFTDGSFGEESREGTPFVYLMRDLLQWTDSLAAAREAIRAAKRTCRLILGVGDGKMCKDHDGGARCADGDDAPFNSAQYSASLTRYAANTSRNPTSPCCARQLFRRSSGERCFVHERRDAATAE